jgi:hypothetical protein
MREGELNNPEKYLLLMPKSFRGHESTAQKLRHLNYSSILLPTFVIKLISRSQHLILQPVAQCHCELEPMQIASVLKFSYIPSPPPLSLLATMAGSALPAHLPPSLTLSRSRACLALW